MFLANTTQIDQWDIQQAHFDKKNLILTWELGTWTNDRYDHVMWLVIASSGQRDFCFNTMGHSNYSYFDINPYCNDSCACTPLYTVSAGIDISSCQVLVDCSSRKFPQRSIARKNQAARPGQSPHARKWRILPFPDILFFSKPSLMSDLVLYLKHHPTTSGDAGTFNISINTSITKRAQRYPLPALWRKAATLSPLQSPNFWYMWLKIAELEARKSLWQGQRKEFGFLFLCK